MEVCLLRLRTTIDSNELNTPGLNLPNNGIRVLYNGVVVSKQKYEWLDGIMLSNASPLNPRAVQVQASGVIWLLPR